MIRRGTRNEWGLVAIRMGENSTVHFVGGAEI